jgi:hypothetical protein
MCYYKWARKSFGVQPYGYYYALESWYHQNGGSDLGEQKSFEVYKRFMTETGTFQPIDFCTYWRNVILWPLVFVLLWMLPVATAVFVFANASWAGLLGSAGLFGGVAGLLTGALFGAIAIIDWLENRSDKPKKVKEPGFFSKVGESMRHPEFCTVIEYGKDAE